MNILKINKEQKSKFKQYAIASTSAVLLGLLCSEPALAAFDIEKGIEGSTTPLIGIITKYYGVAIGIGAATGAMFGEGTPTTRAKSAAVGATLAGTVVLGLLKAIS